MTKPNWTEIEQFNGTIILVSYSTKVAALLPDGTAIRTTTRWSQTTTRHVSKFLSRHPRTALRNVEQVVIDQI